MNHVRWLAVVWGVAACSTEKETRREDETEAFSDQAVKGAVLYTANCAKCHGALGEGTKKAPRVVNLDKGALPLDPPPERQVRKTQFVTVADVARFVVENMPKDKPGSLREADYFRILAFDLKANGVDLDGKHLDMNLAQTLTIPRRETPPTTSQRE
jgi:cytochrome c